MPIVLRRNVLRRVCYAEMSGIGWSGPSVCLFKYDLATLESLLLPCLHIPFQDSFFELRSFQNGNL